jgi:LPS O-antigen subunit length determinant protein (WzzB/FepE family)
LSIIIKKKILILAVTLSTTLAFTFYAYLITPIYKAYTSFLISDETYIPEALNWMSVNRRNELIADLTRGTQSILFSEKFFSETPETLYFKFLTRIQSYSHQRKVYDDGKFANKFFGDADNHNNDKQFLKIHRLISLQEPKKSKDSNSSKPYTLSANSSKPIVAANFLNAIVKTASDDIKNEVIKSVESRVFDALKLNLTQTSFLTTEKKNIEREKLNSLKLRIVRKQEHAISVFEDSLKVAKRLNIKKNQFSSRGSGHLISEKSKNLSANSALSARGYPLWYLYGQEALEEELKIMKERVQDTEFITKHAQVMYEFEKHDSSWKSNLQIPQQNAKLVPFWMHVHSMEKKLYNLKLELNLLKRIDLKIFDPNVVNIVKESTPHQKQIAPFKQKIILGGFGFGVILAAIVVALSCGLERLRTRKNKPNYLA